MQISLSKIFTKQNIFLMLLVLMVLLGKIIPYHQSYDAYFNLDTFIDCGIAGIFLLYGLKLNLKDVIKDVSNWKLHLVVQLATFVLFPLLVVLFFPLVRDGSYFLTWLSIYFLASLPSTVSSSVVMVSIAKGNVTSAIFNASISGLIGIVMTPLLMSFFMKSSAENVDQYQIVYQLLLKVLLPIILGLVLNNFLKKWVTKYASWIAEFDRLIILLIVYKSFSDAFLGAVFTSVPSSSFLVIALAVVGLFFAVYYILKAVSKMLHFSKADEITVTFCGSKKSLVHGSLFVMVLGIPESQKVLFLLPVMLFHSFQLFYVSWLASRLALQSNRTP